MRKLRSLLLFIIACGFFVSGCEEVDKKIKHYSIEEFLGTTTYYWGAIFSPDNSKILVSSDQSGIVNAYAIPIDGSTRVQLTKSETNAIYAISYFPENERFLYTSDKSGNELYHIYVQHPDGSVKDLTPGDSVRAKFVGWAGDRQSFFISTNERDARFFDLYEVATDGYKRANIFENTSGYTIADVSPDGRYVALTKINTNADSNIYVYDVESDDMVKVVRQNNTPIEYIIFDDEGHGFEKKENKIEGYKAIREFLDNHLKGKRK